MSPAGQGAEPAGQKSKRRHPSRALVRRTMDAARCAQERGARQAILRYLRRQHKEIMARLGTDSKAGNDGWAKLLMVNITGDMRGIIDRVEDILRQTVDWPDQERALERELMPIWNTAYHSGAQLAGDTYGLAGVQQPNLTRHLLEQGAARVKGITDTTRQALARTIAEGVAAGDGRNQLIQRVQEAMPGVSPGRAGVIAANETHISLMSGNFDMLKQAGFATKTWLTAGDADVRQSHKRLHGVTVGINEKFPNGLLYPGDPNGPPAEVIGCRCDLVAGEEPKSQPVQDASQHGILRASSEDTNFDQDGSVPAPPEKLTEIPNPTPEAAGAILDQYETEISKETYETAIIVAQDGQAYRIKGHRNGVNIHGLPDEALYGAYMTHNHPDSVTHYSFSAFDISEALKYRFAELRGFDSKYVYILRVLPGTIQKEDYIVRHEFGNRYRMEALQASWDNKIDIDKDEYHYICQRMSEDYGFFYERRKRK